MANWEAYQFHPSFVLGFHGTERDTVDKVVAQKSQVHLAHSTKSYDWLGHGVYFWENDPARGLGWAATGKKNGKIKKPDVVGAIIDLGHCLDLTTQTGLEEVQLAYAANFAHAPLQKYISWRLLGISAFCDRKTMRAP